jgi:hypothetical protein
MEHWRAALRPEGFLEIDSEALMRDREVQRRRSPFLGTAFIASAAGQMWHFWAITVFPGFLNESLGLVNYFLIEKKPGSFHNYRAHCV